MEHKYLPKKSVVKMKARGHRNHTPLLRETCTLSEKQGVRRQQVYNKGYLPSQIQGGHALDWGSNLEINIS